MAVATLSKRDQLAKLVADMQGLADAAEKAGDYSAEDRNKMVDMAGEAKQLKDDLVAEAAATKAAEGLADTKAFLAELGVQDRPATVFDDKPPAPAAGKSLGEAFVKSPEYQDFLSRFARKDQTGQWVIPRDTRGIQSASMQMAGFKTLVTGASPTSAGAVVENMRYMPITDLVPFRPLSIRALCTQASTVSDTVEFVRVTGKTNNAAPVAEATATSGTSGTKPESGMALDVVTTPVETLAHWIPITKRAAADAGQLRVMIDTFLREGLAIVEEDQILNGNGTSPNLRGILQTPGLLTVGSAGTDLDAIVDAIRVLWVTGKRRATGMVVHPNDWFSTGFVLAKDANGGYMIADPNGDPTGARNLWGLQVAVSEAMTENTILVGDFRYAIVWDREQAGISVADQHADFFIRNMLAILAEERLAFGVLDPEAFITVTAV